MRHAHKGELLAFILIIVFAFTVGCDHRFDVIISLNGSCNPNGFAGLDVSQAALGVCCCFGCTNTMFSLAGGLAIRVAHIVMIIFK